MRAVAAGGEVIILAVPFGALDDALQAMADAVQGKVLLDVTMGTDIGFRLVH